MMKDMDQVNDLRVELQERDENLITRILNLRDKNDRLQRDLAAAQASLAERKREVESAVCQMNEAKTERANMEVDLAAAQAERDALLRIKDAADVLYTEAEEYDLPDGLGMGASQEYWDDLANALFPDDSGAVIQADLKNVQAAVDWAWEAFNEELNKPEFLPCGHHHSLMLKSAETGEPLYCELCDCISRRNDAETMEAEARAEAAALRVDAKRYRWLRMNRLWLKANLPMIAAPELDTAIDQARGAA